MKCRRTGCNEQALVGRIYCAPHLLPPGDRVAIDNGPIAFGYVARRVKPAKKAAKKPAKKAAKNAAKKPTKKAAKKTAKKAAKKAAKKTARKAAKKAAG